MVKVEKGQSGKSTGVAKSAARGVDGRLKSAAFAIIVGAIEACGNAGYPINGKVRIKEKGFGVFAPKLLLI